jgi:hypothetical protein
MRKLDGWHVVWMLVLVVATVLLGITLVVALFQRESTTFANFASIWGLFVGLIGFGVTIYTLFETQRVSRKAQQEIQAATVEAQRKIEEAAAKTQEAVKDAQEQTRQVFERVRFGVREAAYWTLLMWLKNLRQATMQRDWARALLIAEESPTVGERLVRAEGLSASERRSLSAGIDNVRLLHSFIRSERMPEGANKLLDLDEARARELDELIRLLEVLGGKLHHESTKGATI